MSCFQAENNQETDMLKWTCVWPCVFGLILMAGCASTSQTPQYVTNWGQLQVGMPRLKAQELLGEPNQASYRKGVSTPYTGGSSKLDAERQELLSGMGGSEPTWSERWQFGSFGLRDVPDLSGGSDKAFIVWIDDWGRVMQFRRPVAGPFAAQTQPSKMQPQ
jgi:hypothetical protein